MRPVRVLSPQIAEKIAAGEVIERPSSVVKELVENALDAGATEILVHLEDGGKSLIEVVDNGHGMTADDLRLCVQRHATSKLERLEDLEAILTLGFRGEALPSVAAVSDLSIVSRPRSAGGSSTASEWRDGQVAPVTFGHFLGAEHGTRVQARGLFSQVPARLKFLRSSSAEVSQVREWIERLALSHPATGFKVMSEERTVLSLKPQTEADRVRAVLADGEDYPVVAAHEEHAGLTVRAYWLQGLSLPHSRRLAQAVNGRALRDKVLQQATLQPFRQALLPGQFPAVALFLQIDPGLIDVNVHPTKTEVRFLDSGKVFRAVAGTLDRAIQEHGAPATARSFAPASSSANPSSPVASGGAGSSTPGWRLSEPAPAARAFPSGAPFSPPPVQPVFSYAAPASASPSPELLPRSPEAEAAESAEAPRAPNPFAGGTRVGILFNTYVLYDLGSELGLLDQHAAHERVRYEKLRSRFIGASAAPATPQALLLPEAVAFRAEQRDRIEARLEQLAALGFEAEIFGEESLLFRSVPAEWGTDELRTRLRNLVERVLELPAGQELVIDEAMFERLASEACHSAIRAGDRLEPLEVDTLLGDLFRCEHPWNCPHGRPTVVRIPRGRFEEWFLRRV